LASNAYENKITEIKKIQLYKPGKLLASCLITIPGQDKEKQLFKGS